MSEKVNIKQALRVFSTIMSEGKRDESDGSYHLQGLVAETDFDGYTATIKNDYVSLSIYFHNKIAFEFSNMKERELFLDKLEAMDKRA